MTLLDALKKRQKVMLIIKFQDPQLETIELALYRVKYLEKLNEIIANLLKLTGHDNIFIEQTGETSGRQTGVDRERNIERGGSGQGTLAIDGNEKITFTERCKLFWRYVETKIYKIIPNPREA